MKLKMLKVFFFISVLTISAAVWSEDELVVRLETENILVPIEVSPFIDDRSGFNKDYIKNLEAILCYDLNHNASTRVNQEKSTYLLCHIEIIVKEKKLIGKVDSDSIDSFSFGPLPLTGSLEKDRRTIHRIADRIHELLFGIQGIASSRILYTLKSQHNGQEESEVWEADWDGQNTKQLTRDGGYCVTPQYIPPFPDRLAGSFVYVSYQTGQPKVYAAALINGQGKQLLSLSGNQLMPTISKQRDRIAFISDATGNPDLFIQAFDPEKGAVGKPRHLFTAPFATQGTPTFSPDGKNIAFVSNTSGTPRIYTIEIPPPGTPLRNIRPVLVSKFTRGNTAPAWSPDGSKIAYCAKIDGTRQIMIYDFHTGIERQLTKGTRNKENPSWAPNSLHLVYNTTDHGACDLYVTNLKQAIPLKITSGQGEKRFPHWEPRIAP